MAFVNLLNGSYSGVMGQTVGVKHKKKPVVRSRVFSKAPMTAAQKTALNNYTSYNQMISPLIRTLLDSGAVKDKSAAAWAYYRKIFKYAIGKTPPYPNCYPLAPNANPRLVTGCTISGEYPSGAARSVGLHFDLYVQWKGPEYNWWFLGKIFPDFPSVGSPEPFNYCTYVGESRLMDVPESWNVTTSGGVSGIIFQPMGSGIRIIDAWQYADSNGIR